MKKPARNRYDGIVVAVGHRQFQAMKLAELRRLAKRNHVLYDIKYVFRRQETDGRL